MRGAGHGALRVVRGDDDRPSLQIARDVALLHDSAGATLRLYGWRPTGLSIGRFQDAAAFAHVDRPHELVRRPTGGGAIWHEADLTYSLTMDDDASVPAEAYYDAIHDALVRALARCGVRAARTHAGGSHPGPRAIDATWCFARPCRGDIVAPDGRKLCGSAQRRLRVPRPRLLQHGSIVMRASCVTPFCASVADQTEPTAIRDALCDAIAQEFALALNTAPEPGALTAIELGRAQQLAASIAIPAFAE